MKIGVPAETLPGEARVALTPEVAKKLIGKGFEVVVERGAGQRSHYHDDQYINAGALVGSRNEALWSDLVLKVRRPTTEDVGEMREGTVFVGHMESCDVAGDEVIGAMFGKGVRPIAMERIPRISRAQSMDALSSQSNIAGYRAVIEAAAHYGRFMPMMMTSAGSSKPARAIVLGAGVAGL